VYDQDDLEGTSLDCKFAEAHKGDRQYGGIPMATIANALDEGSGAQLEALVRAEGFGDQPNPFDAQITSELKSGGSPTWEARFATHLQGLAIAVPYAGLDVTDQASRDAAVRSYQNVVEGDAPRGSVLDIRDVFSDDAKQKLSFVPRPGADGKAVLLQMCARCHDGRGNPQLKKELAISRIGDPGARRMPPWRAGTLTPEAIRAATLALQM
jgi:hypothetical protein